MICVFLYSEKPIWTNEVCINVRSSNSSRLQHVENTGMLIILCLRLWHLLLQKSWGDVWCNLSKMASALCHHTVHCSQIPALIHIRRRCIPGSNSKFLVPCRPRTRNWQECVPIRRNRGREKRFSVRLWTSTSTFTNLSSLKRIMLFPVIYWCKPVVTILLVPSPRSSHTLCGP